MNRFLPNLAAIAVLCMAGSASADTLSLEDVNVGAPGEEGSVSFNYFSLSEADDVDILVVSTPWGDEDHISSQVYLFNEDGEVVASGADIFGGDVELNVAGLQAGNYVLAVGDFPMSAAEAWAGVNDPTFWEASGLYAFDGKYDLSISSDNADLAWISGDQFHAVPELSADGRGPALILLMGGMVLLSERRRRQAC